MTAATQLPPEPTSARTARDFTRYTVAPDRGHEVAEVAALVVSELVTNAVLHARSEILLRLDVGEGTVRIEVVDRSPDELVPPGSPSLDAERGRGLGIVAAVSRRWGVELDRGAKTVWCELDAALDRSSRRSRGDR